MFKFFKKNKKEPKDKAKPAYDMELTGATLAYEIARIDGDVSEDELKVLMEQIKVIASKVGKICDRVSSLIARSLNGFKASL